MIDREKRDHLAHRLRLLAAGQITNWQFEDSVENQTWESNDFTLRNIFWSGGWPLYSDFPEYKLIKKYRLSRIQKRRVAKMILFLKSDRKIEWENSPWHVGFLIGLLGIVTFGLVTRIFYKLTYQKQGDISVWPYIRKSDFDEDLFKQPFLCGC